MKIGGLFDSFIQKHSATTAKLRQKIQKMMFVCTAKKTLAFRQLRYCQTSLAHT